MELVTALALLLAPPDAATPAPDPLLMFRVQGIAVSAEVIDPREKRYVMARPEDFASDLHLLRRRWHDLIDAPPLHDGLRFPDRATVNDFLAFNRAFRRHIDVRQPLESARWWQLRAILQETDQLYQIWDTVRDARCEYYYVTVRRQSLKRLRDAIGWEAYNAGRLPPYIPLHRFTPVE